MRSKIVAAAKTAPRSGADSLLGLVALPFILAFCGALAVIGYLLAVLVFGDGGR